MLVMKKIFLFIITSILIISLSACAEKTDVNNNEDDLITLNVICCLEEKTYTQTFMIDKDYDLDSFIPSIEGYEFQGWYYNLEWSIIRDLDDLIMVSHEEDPKELNVYPKLVKKDCIVTLNVNGNIAKFKWPINSYINLNDDINPLIVKGYEVTSWHENLGEKSLSKKFISSDTILYGEGKLLDGYVDIPIFDGYEEIAHKTVKINSYALLADITLDDKFYFDRDLRYYNEYRGLRIKGKDGTVSKTKLYIDGPCEMETVYYNTPKHTYNDEKNKYYKEDATEEEIEQGISKNGFDAVGNKTIYCIFYIDVNTNKIIATTGYQYIDINEGETFKISYRDIALMSDKRNDGSLDYIGANFDKYDIVYSFDRDKLKYKQKSMYGVNEPVINTPTQGGYNDPDYPDGHFTFKYKTINVVYGYVS